MKEKLWPVPFPDGGNEDDETPWLRIKAFVMETDQVHQAGAFSNAHGRINDAKGNRLLFMKSYIVSHAEISLYCLVTE